MKPERLLKAIFAAALLFMLFTACVRTGAVFSPDSYSYYDIANHIFSGFGEVSTVRQYAVPTDLGVSFPYLYPLLISVTDKLTGLGLYSGIIVNLLAAALTLFLSARCASGLCGSPLPGMIAMIALYANDDYIGEIMSARAVPMSVLCAALLLNALARLSDGGLNPRHVFRYVFLAGVAAGAGMAVRFDFLILAGLLGVLLPILLGGSVRKFFLAGAAYALGLLVFTSPWIIYSINNFHTLWISDNGSAWAMVDVYLPHRYFMPDEFVPTVFNSFWQWIARVHRSFLYIGGHIFRQIIEKPQNLLIVCFAAVGLADALRRGSRDEALTGRSRFLYILLLCAALIYSVKTMAIIAVGFTDMRYHTETIWALLLLAMCAACRARDARLWGCFAATALMFVMAVNTAHTVRHIPARLRDIPRVYGYMSYIKDEAAWVDDLRADSGMERNGDIKVLFLDGDAFRIGAIYGVRSYTLPYNANEERLLHLAANHINPDYVHATAGVQHWINALRKIYTLTPAVNANTYRVSGK